MQPPPARRAFFSQFRQVRLLVRVVLIVFLRPCRPRRGELVEFFGEVVVRAGVGEVLEPFRFVQFVDFVRQGELGERKMFSSWTSFVRESWERGKCSARGLPSSGRAGGREEFLVISVGQ